MKENILLKAFAGIAIAILITSSVFSQCPNFEVGFRYTQSCDTVFFTDTTVVNGSHAISWEWSFDDGSTITTDQNPTHHFPLSGTTYDVKLIVTDETLCSDTITKTVAVNTVPEAGYTFSRINDCAEDTVVFTNTSTGNNLRFTWNFNDYTPTANTVNSSHAFNAKGTGSEDFIVILTAIDTLTLCESVFRDTILVRQKPNTAYTEENNWGKCQTTIGAEEAKVYNHSSDKATIVGYSINWGDLATDYVAAFDSITHTYATSGDYLITIVADGPNGCHSTFQKSFIIAGSPNPAFDPPIASEMEGCTPHVVHITNHFTNITPATVTTIDWDDGQTDTYVGLTVPATIDHVYTQSACTFGGMSAYKIKAEIQGCMTNSSSLTDGIKVYQAPQADFTVASDTICLGSSVTFTNTTEVNYCADNPSTDYSWNFGDGSPLHTSTGTPSDPTPGTTHLYAAVGEYSIQLTATNSSTNGCGATTVTRKIVVVEPVLDFAFDTVCFGEMTTLTDLSYMNGGGIIHSRDWDFGDGTFAIGAPALFGCVYDNPGTYTVTLTTHTSGGCILTTNKTILVDSIPDADFSYDTACVLSATLFHSNSKPNASSMLSYEWIFGDGHTGAGLNTSNTYATSGLKNVKLITTNSNGCKDTIVHVAKVYELPKVGFTTSSACVGDATFFTDTSTNDENTNVSWQWNFGDGTPSVYAKDTTHQYATSGIKTVSLEVTDDKGCQKSYSKPITVYIPPTASFTVDTVCFNDSTTFTSTSSPGDGSYQSIQWLLEPGIIKSGSNPKHKFSHAGLDTVRLTIINTHGCRDTVYEQVKVYELPKAGFTTNPVCLHDTAIFLDTSLAVEGSLDQRYWKFETVTYPTTSSSIKHAFNNAGANNVQLIVLNTSGCRDTIEKNINIYALPSAGFTAPNVCLNNYSSFTDTSKAGEVSISSRIWNFGDDSTGVGSPVIHKYLSAGIKNVELIVTNNRGCKDTIVRNTTVFDLPQAQFNFDTACLGSPINFTDQSTPAGGTTIPTHGWNFGEGNVSTLPSPSHAFADKGFNDVRLIVTDNHGCKDTIEHRVITSRPDPGFISYASCSGNPIQVFDISTSTTGIIQAWHWNFGDGNTSDYRLPIYRYFGITTPTVFDVTLIATDNYGCVDSVTYPVTVNPSPVVDFTANDVFYNNATTFTDLSYSDGGTLTNWSWNFGDGIGVSTTKSPTYTYSAVGKYVVNLDVTDTNGCYAGKVKLVSVLTPFTPMFAADTVCEGVPTQFEDQTTIYSSASITNWLWNFGDGNFSTIQSPSHIYSGSGDFQVKLIVTNSEKITDSSTSNVWVHPKPKVDYTSSPMCQGKSVNFANSTTISIGNIASWLWDFSNGTTASDINPQNIIFDSLKNYQIKLKAISDQGCVDSISKSLQLYANPIVNFNAMLREGCLPLSIDFTDSSQVLNDGLASWEWNFGDGTISTTSGNASHTYYNSGTYSVGLKVYSDHQCSSEKTMDQLIAAYDNPKADFAMSSSESSIKDPLIAFTDQSTDAIRWKWYFGDGDSSNVISPSHFYNNPGTYFVKLWVYNHNNCLDTITKNVEITTDNLFIMPSAFTPNGDGINDELAPKGFFYNLKEYQMIVYNRMGLKVFSTNNSSESWDGNIDNGSTQAPKGVYVWKIIIKDSKDYIHEYNGQITLLR